MAPIRSSADIAAHLAAAAPMPGSAPRLDNLKQNVGSLLEEWPRERGIYAQLKRLAEFIEATKTEIAALQPGEVNSSFIPTATDELDAIVEATASASNRIMDAADVLTEIAGRLSAPESDKVMAVVTSIFEACTFQDITGQRITKVVKTLKVIQQRLDQMVKAVGHAPTGASSAAAPVTAQGDAALLNGPALPGNGRNQDEIDALLASFD